MAIRMQQRRGTAEQWDLINPVLAEGEIGLETDTNKFKVGNGVDSWSTLTYFLDETALTGSLEDYVLLVDVGQPNGVASLDANGQVPASQLTAYATETYVNTAVSNLVDAAPATLDTLNELAAALGDDANFATTVTTALGNKSDVGHTHAIADVTNLQTSLDGKAEEVHTHTFSDVTDTQINAPAAGQTLVYNGTKWVNQPITTDPNPQIFMLMGA